LKTLYQIPLIFSALLLLCTQVHAQKSALLWATYFGSDTLVYGGGLATDDSGNVYISGETHNKFGIATKGAYKTIGDSINGAPFLAKFSSAGSLLWATYYGSGGGAEAVHTDKFGNVYLTGWTNSASGIATYGAYQTSYTGGASNAFLAKFNSAGSLLWATYYGKDDWGSDLASDSSGDIYLTGSTGSDSGIATSGAYRTSLIDGKDNGFLAKFNSGGNLLWATYYGLNGDVGYGIASDAHENVYITGVTNYDSSIATFGAYQTSFAGGSEAFLAKFNSAGSLLWGTYYGGDGFGEGQDVATDIFGNVYISGFTFATNGIATSGAYQTFGDSVNGDVFLAKFNGGGSLLWGTYYGGNGEDVANGVATDRSGNVYITGGTGSTSGIATSGSYLTSFIGGYDLAYLAKFSTTGSLVWGTYYGIGETVASNIALDASDNIYVYGFSFSTSGMATSGAYQTSNYDGNGYFLAKFHVPVYYNDAGIASVLEPTGIFCVGSIPVKVQLKNFGIDTLKSVKINWSINSKPQPVFKWTGSLKMDSSTSVSLGSYNFATGIDTIVAWTSSPNGTTDSFPWNDTAQIVDTIKPVPDAHFSITSIAGSTYRFAANSKGQSSYKWTFGDGKTGTKDTITHTYKKDSTYSVSLEVENPNNCVSSFDTSFSVLTGLKNIAASQFNLHIFPNPFSDLLNINYSTATPSRVKISITDMEGSLIATLADEEQESGNHNLQFDASKNNFSTGVYYLRLIIGDEVIVSKIIKIV